LLGAALGMPRDDDRQLARLAHARMAVRVDREGDILSDYHTAGAGTFRGKRHRVFGTDDPVITRRAYLSSASFLVALQHDDDWVEEVDQALGLPRWPLALGRRACSPTVPVRAGVAMCGAEEAVRRAAFPSSHAPSAPLRLVVECEPGDPGAEPRQDQPLSFRLHHRMFARRWVRTAWLGPEELELLPASAESVSIVHLARS
jgi:CRISPR system Cascade subunit CasD